MTRSAAIGIFSTLTSTGSRALVTTIARACRDGTVPGARVAFVLCNREGGESDVTDASVALIEREFDFPVVRASAVRFRADERKAARAAAEAGDEAPLWAWRDAYYGSYRDRLPASHPDSQTAYRSSNHQNRRTIRNR